MSNPTPSKSRWARMGGRGASTVLVPTRASTSSIERERNNGSASLKGPVRRISTDLVPINTPISRSVPSSIFARSPAPLKSGWAREGSVLPSPSIVLAPTPANTPSSGIATVSEPFYPFAQVTTKVAARRPRGLISSASHGEVPQTTLLVEEQEKVTTSLNIIFDKVMHYRRLLACGKGDAQKVLDAFQTLLDTESFTNRGQLIAAMRRLSERTNLYPTRFFLKGASLSFGDEAVTAGSFADIYRIVFRGEETCLKVIRLYQRSEVEHMAKVYAREAILWAQLSHPNILPFYGFFQFGSRLSFVSRWATNGNLEEYLARTPGANRLLLCLDTAAGVEYLHKNDIVHGDLKGANILIDRSGRAAVSDFGLASVTDPQILKWSTQSTMASKGGTPRWQAPELLGSEDTSEKIHNSKESDVFAWANICYEIFTGRLPYYEILKPTSVMLSIMRGKIPTRPQDGDRAWLEHGLNNRIWELMKDCWDFEPSERPTMTTVLLKLDAEKPLDSRPTGEWVGKVAMRFRNAQDAEVSKDMLPFWEELGLLLSRIVPGIEDDVGS